MEKEFVTYEIALDLKELGFDEPCFGYYIGGDWDHDEYDMTFQFQIDLSKGNYLLDDKKCTAPTFSQAFKWFREKYKIECYVNCYWSEEDSTKRTYFANYNYGSDIFYSINIEFKTYEEAELECLKKLISIVKNK